jgi:hypothetical protein
MRFENIDFFFFQIVIFKKCNFEQFIFYDLV